MQLTSIQGILPNPIQARLIDVNSQDETLTDLVHSKPGGHLELGSPATLGIEDIPDFRGCIWRLITEHRDLIVCNPEEADPINKNAAMDRMSIRKLRIKNPLRNRPYCSLSGEAFLRRRTRLPHFSFGDLPLRPFEPHDALHRTMRVKRVQ